MTMTQPQRIRRPREHRPRPGFTLVEILIVISIAAVVMTVIAGGAFATIRAMKASKTKATLAVLQKVMDDYKHTTENYPAVYAAGVWNPLPSSVLGAAPNYWPPTTDSTRTFLGIVYYGETPVNTVGTLDDADKVAGKHAVGSARDLLQAMGTGNTVFDRTQAIIKDGWGNPIFVSSPGSRTTHAKFSSAGPDENPNTTADNLTTEGGSQ